MVERVSRGALRAFSVPPKRFPKKVKASLALSEAASFSSPSVSVSIARALSLAKFLFSSFARRSFDSSSSFESFL
jgi:hypothetical protein